MISRLESKLAALRRRHFVGREAELAFLSAALDGREIALVYVYGPGGVGKSALLDQFAVICAQQGIHALKIDARHIDPVPEAFLVALRQALQLEPSLSPLEALAASSQRQVLLVDSYEQVLGLEPWLRNTFLPELPGETLIVLAGRQPPDVAWRVDPGWQALMRVLSLRNLSPAESRLLLRQRSAPEAQHDAIIAHTYGHPLALSLVADVFDQQPDRVVLPAEDPNVVQLLLGQFLEHVPSPMHRMALEACALVRFTTEPLLAALLDVGDARSYFEWLRALSFVEAGIGGLYPQDLVREVLVADLRWRNPAQHEQLHRRARLYFNQQLEQAEAARQQAILIDYIYLHRNNPVVRPFYIQLQQQARRYGGLIASSANADDWPTLAGMVALHEGEASAHIARHWFQRQPKGVTVFRDAQQRPAAFLAAVALHESSEGDRQLDAGAAAAWRYLQERAPLRQRERATLFRFWMAEATYQALSPAVSLIFVHTVRHYLSTPGLAFTFLPCAAPAAWAAVFAYVAMERLPEADFEVEGRRFGVFGRDWRTLPLAAWLDLMAERETATAPLAAPPAQQTSPVIVLSRPAFAAAMLDVLRRYNDAESLRSSPLLNSRLVIGQVGLAAAEAERVQALRRSVQQAAEALQLSPQDAKYYRAFYHAWLQPAATQEQAAEMVGTPYSSFRRHLKRATETVIDLLWRQETGD